jgi:predicted ATPase
MNRDIPLPSPDATRSPLPAAHGGPRWQVRVLGAFEASDGVQHISRFPSRAVAALLARLALWPARAHPREELVELLWPGVDLAVGRNRLRQALSALKSLLEPVGVPGGTVLHADRHSVRAVPGALGCDARDFEHWARQGDTQRARAGYGGDFMPGHYEDWAQDERLRLSALFEGLGAEVLAPVGPAAGRPADATAPGAPAPATAGAGRSVAGPPGAAGNPLPSYLTRLFGVDRVAARLCSLVRQQRLVTLLGPGGSGKTRLGVEVARALRNPPVWPPLRSAPGPVDERLAALDAPGEPPFERIAFVPLVACSEAAQMLDAVARVLQLPAAALAAALAGRHVLLVLDNFEQMADDAAAALADLQAQLPLLHLLVTSRRALGLDGECCITAEPLAVPPGDAPLAVAAANPAVALFVNRARAVRADFRLAERNHAAIVTLVRALHGMPLAIELAASRVRSFPPAEMVGLLASPVPGASGPSGGQLALLARSGPRAGLDARHASMAAVIAWSWRLLDAEAQRLLAALTLFAADATAAAVACVVDAPLARAAAGLDGLVAHSMVRLNNAVSALPAGGDDSAPQRFGVVEPVREFVAAQWPAADQAAMRTRLRRWLIVWAEGLGRGAAPARVAPDLPTVHAVLAGAAAQGAPEDALALMRALRAYWDTDALPGRIQNALAQALQDTPDAAPALRSSAHELFAYLRFEAGFVAEARAHADAALQAAGDDPSLRARALVRGAWVEIAGTRGEDEAGETHRSLQARLQAALALARGCGDREAQALALQQLGVLANHVLHDIPQCEALMAESQALWLALGDHRKAYARLRNRAQCWVQLGRQAEAMAAYAQCEQAALAAGDWVGQIDTWLSRASLRCAQRDWSGAVQDHRRGVALCWQRWHRHGLAYALWNPPRPLARLQRPEPAMRLMGFAASFWQANFGPLSRSDRRDLRRVRALVRAQIGAARTEALEREGAAMDLAAAVALALNA